MHSNSHNPCGDDLLRSLIDTAQKENKETQAFLNLLKVTGRKSSHLIITYRCPKRCTLFEVYRLPNGLVFRQPRYRLSPEENLRGSSESGRKKNTIDGDRRWKEQAGPLVDGIHHQVSCDHMLKYSLATDDVLRRLADGVQEVTLQNPSK